MSKTIRADEMAMHINRLRKTLALIEGQYRTPVEMGEARGLLAYTINELIRVCTVDVAVEDIAP